MQPSADNSLVLRTFLQENMESLQGIVRSYVARAGLAQNESLQNVAHEILNEAILEALAHADVFETVRQPRAWFLGITANIIKRHRAHLLKYGRRELSIGSLFFAEEDASESDFFDRLVGITHPGPEQEVEMHTQVAELLSGFARRSTCASSRLLQDLDTNSLALTLGVPPGTARVRLHRALHRLRVAWKASSQQKQERGYHA